MKGNFMAEQSFGAGDEQSLYTDDIPDNLTLPVVPESRNYPIAAKRFVPLNVGFYAILGDTGSGKSTACGALAFAAQAKGMPVFYVTAGEAREAPNFSEVKKNKPRYADAATNVSVALEEGEERLGSALLTAVAAASKGLVVFDSIALALLDIAAKRYKDTAKESIQEGGIQANVWRAALLLNRWAVEWSTVLLGVVNHEMYKHMTRLPAANEGLIRPSDGGGRLTVVDRGRLLNNNVVDVRVERYYELDSELVRKTRHMLATRTVLKDWSKLYVK